MNFLSSLAKSAQSGSDEPKKAGAGEETAPSTTDLFASAKVLADAAQSQFNKGSEPGSAEAVDNKKVASAAADILEAAQQYGKLDETQGIGQYVEKAENYLHQYGAPEPKAVAEKEPAAEEAAKPKAAEETEDAVKPPAKEEAEVAKPAADDEVKPAADDADVAKPPAVEDTEEAKPPAPVDKPETEEEPKIEEKAPVTETTTEDEGKKSEGYGEYAKVAEGFIKEKLGEGESEGGNTTTGADYLKAAGDFFSKK